MLLLTVMLFIAPAAGAQIDFRPRGLTAAAGAGLGSSFAECAVCSGNSGTALFARVGAVARYDVMVNLEASRMKWARSDAACSGCTPSSEASVGLASLMLSTQWYRDPGRPYFVKGGFGWTYGRATRSVAPGTTVSRTEDSAALKLGGGIDVPFTSAFALTLQLEYIRSLAGAIRVADMSLRADMVYVGGAVSWY